MARLTAKTIKSFPIPGDSDGAFIKILHLKRGEVQKIESETSHWEGLSVDDKFQSKLLYNPQVQLRKLRVAALVGFGKFYDEDGNELESDTRNIIRNRELLLDADPEIGVDVETGQPKPLTEWIDQFRKELSDSLKPQEEQSEGN